MRFCYASLSSLMLQHDTKVHIHWKGAAEIVLASCTEYVDSNDSFQPMGEEDKVQANALLYLRKTFLLGQNLIFCYLYWKFLSKNFLVIDL